MQFTINGVTITLFGTMSQNYYQEVSNYFGISMAKELIHNRFKKLVSATDVRRTITNAA